jgi:hypothetical protein
MRWFALLVACRRDEAPEETSVPEDTDAPVETIPVDDIFQATVAPYGWWRSVREWENNGPGDCPTAYAIDETHWRIDGAGCVDDEGATLTGSIEWLDGPQGERIGFLGFAVVDDAGTRIYEGEIVVDNAAIMTSSYTVRDAAGTLVLAYNDHTFSSLSGFQAAWLQLGPGSSTVSGQLTVLDRGIYELAGTIDHTGACDQEPDGGAIDLTGPETVGFGFDGAAVCDGCVPYTEPLGTGELCPFSG